MIWSRTSTCTVLFSSSVFLRVERTSEPSRGGTAARAGRAVEKVACTLSQASPVRCQAVAQVTISSLPCLASSPSVTSRTRCSGRHSAQGVR